MAESDDEHMMDDLFEEQVDERIQHGDQNAAFRLIKGEKEKKLLGVSRGALNELTARVLRCRNAPDKDVLNAFGETNKREMNSDGPQFIFPYSYIVYGAVTPFKEGPGSKINIYKRGIEAANYKRGIEASKGNDDNADKVAVVAAELERLVEVLEIAEQKKAENLEKKRKKKMVVPKQGEEEKKVEKVDVVELEQINEVAEHEALVKKKEDENFCDFGSYEMVVPRQGEEEKKVEKVDVVELEQLNEVSEHEALVKKREDDILCDFGSYEFFVPFNFSSFRTSGKNCCKCIENAGKFQVNKSLVTRHPLEGSENFQEIYSICLANHSLLRVESAFPNPNNDRTVVLVCEVVSTLHHYFEAEFQKLAAGSCEKVTGIQWWKHILDKFKTIFRDVIQGLRFLYSKTDYGFGGLKFGIFVTEDGRGRILPSLGNGIKEIIKDIGQLKDAMIAVLAYPFDGKMSYLEKALPWELEWFLNFDFTQCTSSWFLVNCPIFWTVKERVRFPHVLKRLFMGDYKIKKRVEILLRSLGHFKNWQSVPRDVFETILKYHEKRKNEDPSYSNRYEDRCDICRFFVAVYGHLNDKMYKEDPNALDYEEDEIEAMLSNLYPDFYVVMFECLCFISGDLADEELRNLSGL